MIFNYYILFYCYIILLILFLCDQLLLFLLVFVVKWSFFINIDADIEYEFDFGSIDNEEWGPRYVDIDTEDEYYYTLVYEEMYLISNCRFFFDLYGGETVLDCIDFIDFNIYKIKDNRNYKNIYLNMQVYKESWNYDENYYEWDNIT